MPIQISNLQELTVPAADDYIPSRDTSAGIDKRASYATISAYVVSSQRVVANVALDESNSAAANTAELLAAMSGGNVIVRCPAGSFDITALAFAYDGITIEGSGQPGITAARDGLEWGTSFVGRFSLGNRKRLRILNLGIDASGTTDGITSGTDLDGEQQVALENLTILGSPGNHCILLSSGGGNFVHSMRLYKSAHGLALRCSYTTASDIYVEDCSTSGVVIKGAGAQSARYNNVRGITAIGTTLGSQGAAVFFDADGSGLICEYNTASGIVAQNATFGVRFAADNGSTVQYNSALGGEVKSLQYDGLSLEQTGGGTVANNLVTGLRAWSVGSGRWGFANSTSNTTNSLINCWTDSVPTYAGPFAIRQINGSDATDIYTDEMLRAMRSRSSSVYMLRDEFTTALASAAINGTNAEPGRGSRVAIDTESKQSITGGTLSVSGGMTSPAAGDPALSFGDVIAREPGRMIVAQLSKAATTGLNFIGFNTLLTGSPTSGTIRWGSAILNADFSSSPGPAIDSYAGGESLRVAIILLDVGAAFLVKHASGDWKIRYMRASGSAALLYACIANYSAAYTSTDWGVPRPLWLPTPDASDSFASAFGTTDGLGHLQTTGIGAGGSGKSWTQVGTWGISSAKAIATVLSGGVAFATVPLTSKDQFLSVNPIRSGGNVGLVARYADASNYLIAYHDGTNVKLDQVVATVVTNRISAAATYSASAPLILSLDGNNARLFYNNALVGSTSSIDAGLTATAHGLYTTNTGNTLDAFYAYPTGTSAEYAFLNDY